MARHQLVRRRTRRRPHNTGNSAAGTRRASQQFPSRTDSHSPHNRHAFLAPRKVADKCPTRKICIPQLSHTLCPDHDDDDDKEKASTRAAAGDTERGPSSKVAQRESAGSYVLTMERATFSYVPTPYFSFLVGTQRDIVGVPAPAPTRRWWVPVRKRSG